MSQEDTVLKKDKSRRCTFNISTQQVCSLRIFFTSKQLHYCPEFSCSVLMNICLMHCWFQCSCCGLWAPFLEPAFNCGWIQSWLTGKCAVVSDIGTKLRISVQGRWEEFQKQLKGLSGWLPSCGDTVGSVCLYACLGHYLILLNSDADWRGLY